MAKLKAEDLPKFVRVGLREEIHAAARIAGNEALKTARRAVVKYVEHRKALDAKSAPIKKYINRSIKTLKPKKTVDFTDMVWELRVNPIKMPMAAYPHHIAAGFGVVVEINRGKPQLVPHAFLALVQAVSRAGELTPHDGIFVREAHAVQRRAQNKWGITSLPIRQLYSSTLADVVSDGLAKASIQHEAQQVFGTTYTRVLENGIARMTAAKWARRAAARAR